MLLKIILEGTVGGFLHTNSVALRHRLNFVHSKDVYKRQAIGLIFGIFLHAFVVKTAEVDMVMFGREIKWLSYVFSALLTIFFSIIVNLVMYRKLKKISMVESMKSTE